MEKLSPQIVENLQQKVSPVPLLKVEKTPLQKVDSVDHVIPFVCFPIKVTVTVKVVCKTKTKPIRLNTKNWNVKK